MEQKIIPPFSSTVFQTQAMNYANTLSALYSIPTIESLYDTGCSINQLQNLRAVFDILISSNRYTDAFRLFIIFFQDITGERPIPLYALSLFPVLIPLFLFAFLEDFDSLLEEFTLAL